MRHRQITQRGNSIVEMALITAPLFLFLMATMELARGMWTYHTVAAATKQGSRFVVVHGARCVSASSACQTTIGATTNVITTSGVGLDPAQLQLTFNAGNQTYTCNPAASCSGDATNWPPASNNAVGLPITITANYNFQSVMGFLWPGQMGSSFNVSAGTTEIIEF
jgi:Flp pilus assembly protein TadG